MTSRTGEAVVTELLDGAKKHEAEVLARHPELDSMAMKDLLRGMIARPRKGRRQAIQPV